MMHQSTCVDRSVTKALRALCDVEVGPEEELEAPMEQEYGTKSIVAHICPTEIGAHVVSKGRAGQRHALRIPPERMD